VMEGQAALDFRQHVLLDAVETVMDVRAVTAGSPGDGFQIRFSGTLQADTQAAFAELQPTFKAEGMTLFFREHDGEHHVLGVPGVVQPQPSRRIVNLVLLILTLFSMLFSGALSVYQGPVDVPFGQVVIDVLRSLDEGIPFAISLLAILVAHEFGHYIAARRHGTAVTLPYFIPFPGSPFGTMGAFIQLKEPPRNKRVLLDIGIAGPLAGLVVAIPVLLIGLARSSVEVLPAVIPVGSGQVLEGNSILYLAAKYLAKGELLPMPASYGGVQPVVYWIRYLFSGRPLPLGGRDILLDPVAWAGWAGLLVTSLNLIPAGQLDGGHVLYVLFGKRARIVWPVIFLLLLLLGMAWPGWYLWAGLIFLLGRRFAQPLDDVTPLDPGRRALAIFGLIVAVLVFIPVPLIAF